MGGNKAEVGMDLGGKQSPCPLCLSIMSERGSRDVLLQGRAWKRCRAGQNLRGEDELHTHRCVENCIPLCPTSSPPCCSTPGPGLFDIKL